MVYTRSIALGVQPVQIWQQGYHNNVSRFGQVFTLFLGIFVADYCWILFVYFECHKCYLVAYFCRTPTRCHMYGNCSKTLVCNGVNDYLLLTCLHSLNLHFHCYYMSFRLLYLSFHFDFLHRHPDSRYFSHFHPDSLHFHSNTCIPTLVFRIPLILFPNSPFRFLQITYSACNP